MRPFRYKVDLLTAFLFVFSPLPMPHDYQTKAKTQFPLPEYPQEEKFKDAVQYETAVTRFGVDRAHILVQHDEWVDREQIADITHASEAAHLQAEADKQQHKAEEAKEVKDRRASEGERCPKKQGRTDTAGASIMAVGASSGRKKRWKVCAYCAKRGKVSQFFFP